MVQVIGWAVLALAASWAICTNIALRQHYKHSDEPALPANATALTQLTGVVGALVVALILLLAPNLLKNLPSAALAITTPPVVVSRIFNHKSSAKATVPPPITNPVAFGL